MTAKAVPPRRPAVLRHGLPAVVAALLALGGCAAPGSEPTPGPTVISAPVSSPTPLDPTVPGPGATPTVPSGVPADPEHARALRDAQTAVDHLFAAGVAGDRSGWDAGIAALDEAFAVRSAVLFDNLRSLRPARLRVRLTGAELRVPPARLADLGAGARVLQAHVDWRLRGEAADASSTVWLTLVPRARSVRLAGTGDGETVDSPALPLWWLAPVTRVTQGPVTVLVGHGQDVRRWARLVRGAAAAAHQHLPRTLRSGWDGHLVVEVPADETGFTQVLGAAPGAYAGTAAVTRPEGPTTGAALRVVVNPAIAGDPDRELGTTLTHETVHVATRSAASSAPLWAVEGLAEYVALEAHPDQRAAELAVLRGAARPARLPVDRAFTAGGKDVTAAYAQAWLACRAVAKHRSRSDLGRLYAALEEGRTLEQASRSALGVDDGVLVGWWRAELRRAAAGEGG